MKKAAVILSLALLSGIPAFASSHRSSGGSRTYYGGGRHTETHGGYYRGGLGSSHKGGHYSSPTGGHSYGRHK